MEYSLITVSNDDPYIITLSQQNLNNLGFDSGVEVFISAYGVSFWDNAYDDPDLTFRVFPNLNTNAPAPISFIVP